jgi:hypothetical protein
MREALRGDIPKWFFGALCISAVRLFYSPSQSAYGFIDST